MRFSRRIATHGGHTLHMYRILHENRNAVEGIACCVPDATDWRNTMVRGITVFPILVVIRLVQPCLRAPLN